MIDFSFFKKIISIALLLVFSCGIVFSAEPTVTIEPYTKEQIPNWAKDIRRTEIITLGSLPFVTIGVTMGYSFYRVFSNDMNFSYFINPLSSSASASLSEEEQKGLIISSVCISALIGLTDLTINFIQRKISEKKEVELEKGSVIIEPVLPEIIEENEEEINGNI